MMVLMPIALAPELSIRSGGLPADEPRLQLLGDLGGRRHLDRHASGRFFCILSAANST